MILFGNKKYTPKIVTNETTSATTKFNCVLLTTTALLCKYVGCCNVTPVVAVTTPAALAEATPQTEVSEAGHGVQLIDDEVFAKVPWAHA